MHEWEYLIEARKLSKHFGVTVALDEVSFGVKPGEIRGLIGENGSGKSTASSIFAGMQQASGGEVYYKGEPWKPATMLEAQENGICMIVQETGTIPNITVAENIFLGHEKEFAKGPFVSRRKMIKAANDLLAEVGITGVEASRPMGSYDFQTRKLVEVAKALYWKPDLFIVDETTTALSQSGRELVYRLSRRLSEEGKAVMMISHDLDEIMTYCDTLTVLRDGKIVGNLEKCEFDPDLIKQMMVGREISGDYYHSDMDGYSEEVVLKADCITTMSDLLCFSIELHKGEILGIGGLSHCGMHTLGKALFGAEKVLDGEVKVGPNGVKIKNTVVAIRNGVGYVSKNRDLESLCLQSPIYDNIAATGYKTNRGIGPLISLKKEKSYVRSQIEQLSIKCASMYHRVATLSGGNKQKVAMGRWIAADSDILILDCPTRGIDIGVKAAMYQLIYDMKKAGKSIVLISEELPELIGMSDRIVIMKDGEITYDADRKDGFSEQKLIQYMI